MSTTAAKTILSELNGLDLASPSSHRDAIIKAQSLINTLQDPGDKAMENLFVFTTTSALFSMHQLGVFEKLSKAQGPLTATQLGEQTGGDPLLVARMMRSLTPNGVANEVGPETYAPTAVTHLYAQPAWDAGLRFATNAFAGISRGPSYLQHVNYRNPDSTLSPGPFQYCMQSDLPIFEWLAQNPHMAADFNLFMTNHRPQAHWTDTFPVQEKLFNDGAVAVALNPAAPLVVDVAGGFGHDLRIVKKKLLASTPKGSGSRFVLEDQPSVIDSVPDDLHDADIEYVKHDFFAPQPQPVHGARVYTLKSILHDWADDKALTILRNLAAAMQPGYSKIWILDGIVPETNAPRALVGMDITMMLFLCALERTEAQWRGLLDRAGLVITDVQKRADGFGVVEAMLK